MHRDIKGANVLVDQNSICKLAGNWCFFYFGWKILEVAKH